MADLDGQFDSNQVEPQKPMVPLKTGWYPMAIVESVVKETSSGNGNKYLQLVFQIDENRDSENAGRKVWARLNLWNSNPKASEIAQQELSAICRACGVPQITDSEQLHFIPMSVRVAYVPPKGEYQESNDTKGFAPLSKHFGGIGNTKQQTQQQPQTQHNQTQQQTQPMNTGNQAPAGNESPPWTTGQ